MKSIKIKLVILYLVLVFMVMVVSSTFILLTYRNKESANAETSLKDSCDSINSQVISGGSEKSFDDSMKALFRTQGVNYDSSFQAFIIKKDGSSVVSSSLVTQSSTPVEVLSPVIISAVNGTDSFQAWRLDSGANGFGRRWFEYAKQTDKYIIYVRTDATKSNQAVGVMASTLVWGLVIALTLTGVVGLFFAISLTSPIVALTNKARDLAQGNLADDVEELNVFSNDEIGQLTQSFNFMAKELKFNIDSISTEKNKLEIILHNMNDGVLAYNGVGQLLHANNAVSDLLGANVSTLNLVEFTEEYNLVFSDTNFDEGITIAVGEKFINLNIKKFINYFNKTNGTVIVLQDITKHKKLDNMRKEFVANVSHELRTPLTTIKSYTETLLDGGLSSAEISTKFLGVIDKEVDRMALLVTDLLDLSRFDNHKMELKMEKVNLIKIINHTISQNQILMDKKCQTVTFFYNKDIDYCISGDKGRINQVFNNIISNSIKYSPESSSINITADEDKTHYIIYIRDNGIGIPKADLKLIFDRFYRVDKARSREMGGTGLGLAITKEIIEAHGGKIKAQSILGQGTTMIMRFPKEQKA